MTKIFLIIVFLSQYIFPQSLEEKINSLIFVAYDIKQEKQIIKATDEGIGGIQIQYGTYSLKKTRDVFKKVYKSSKYLPPFIAIDYEGGSVYLHQTHGLFNLPSNMAIGSANDYENTSTLFYLLGLELKKAGINTVFSPTVDVNTQRDNPIINIRAFSDNKETVYNMGRLVIKGFNSAGIITTIKHFPGHGMTSSDSHLTLPVSDIEPIKLYNTHIYPFKRLIADDMSDMIMLSHIIYKNVDDKYPASLSQIIMKDILRQQLKYNGVIITDSLDMKAITSKYTVEDAAVIALKNGADMVLVGKYDYRKVKNKIMDAVSKKEILIDDINQSYTRIIELKKKYNLKKFEINSDNFDMAYKDIALKIAKKTNRIIKDEGQNVPLNKNEKIYVIFFVPQRFSDEAIIFYKGLSEKGYRVKFNMISSDSKINLDKTANDLKQYDTLIIANYSWPYTSLRRREILTTLAKNSKKNIFINLLNPYDTDMIKNDFQTIIETYNITEFSMKTLSELLTEK
jgi:beta-N-acetylhexosaminidase